MNMSLTVLKHLDLRPRQSRLVIIINYYVSQPMVWHGKCLFPPYMVEALLYLWEEKRQYIFQHLTGNIKLSFILVDTRVIHSSLQLAVLVFQGDC